MQIKWTKQASNNLDSILSYIHADNPEASKKFLANTLKKIAHLENNPLLGRAGRVPQSRELVIHENYIAHYRVKNEQIEIFRVLHVRRKYPS